MKSLTYNIDRTNAFVAAAVWLTVFVIYGLTRAATVSYWDCGEFIASSYILGVPHPPGTPLYIIMGRIFSMIPFTEDISARLNLLSGICSAFAAMFAYLVGVRALRSWFADSGSLYSRILLYAGAASGTMFLAFGRTNWGNSVEAEVYGMSMMLMMGILWLTLIYLEKRGTHLADKIMVLVVYLAFLGIGVHMTTFLILPVCALVFILKKETPLSAWFMLGVFFVLELYLIFALSSRPDEIPYYLPVAIASAFYAFYALSFERLPKVVSIIGIGLLVSLAPGVAYLTGRDSLIWNVVGLVALGATICYSLYLLYQWFEVRKKGKSTDTHTVVAASFAIGAGLMAAVLVSNIRGYGSFLVLSVLLLAVIGFAVWRYVRLPVLIALVGSAMIILGVKEYVIGSAVALGVIALMGLVSRAEGWRTAMMIVLVAGLGFSVHTFLPLRAAQNPVINESDPSTSLEATVNYIERKQYGSQSMVDRMFKRRAEWSNQFGNYRRMGFWGFFSEQYGVGGIQFVALIMLGLFGAWEVCRRKPEIGVILIILILVTSVGLILYMNFADGSRRLPSGGDYIEVRNRDYFFTPAFMLFGLAMGLGMTGFIQYVREMTRKFSQGPRKGILAALLVLYLIPINTVASNYFFCDRSNNYIAYDYAWNMLASADENAILFTAGDNDTFPVWCLQEVYGVRTDVKVVNLSLANADWYINQIKEYQGLETGWTEEDTRELRPFRYPDGRVMRIQDQVITQLVRHHWGKRPINYGIYVNPGSRTLNGTNVDSLVELSGLMYRLTDTAGGFRVDIDGSLDLFMNPEKFRYRGLNDPSIYKNETTVRNSIGVTRYMLQVTNALSMKNRMEEALEITEFTVDKIPHSEVAVEALVSLYSDMGRTEKMARLLESTSYPDTLRLTAALARSYRAAGEPDRAEQMLLDLLERHPGYRGALDEVMALYVGERSVDKMVVALRNWVLNNPGDQNIKNALTELEKQLKAQDSPEADSL
ncbi:MAG: DUF2723 domain-containing protein [bacterium]|nr:DUF2723 domain-containing protein [bacterium]